MKHKIPGFDVSATLDLDIGAYSVSPISTRAFEWFAVIFNPKNALADGSYCVKSLDRLRVRGLQVSVSD